MEQSANRFSFSSRSERWRSLGVCNLTRAAFVNGMELRALAPWESQRKQMKGVAKARSGLSISRPHIRASGLVGRFHLPNWLRRAESRHFLGLRGILLDESECVDTPARWISCRCREQYNVGSIVGKLHAVGVRRLGIHSELGLSFRRWNNDHCANHRFAFAHLGYGPISISMAKRKPHT